MGNDWLADAWGDNPLSDPAISDAETTSDAAEGKATGFSDWHPAAHGYVEDKPDPDSVPYRSSSSRSFPRTRGGGAVTQHDAEPRTQNASSKTSAERTSGARKKRRNPDWKKGFRRPKNTEKSPFAPAIGAHRAEEEHPEKVRKKKRSSGPLFREGSALNEPLSTEEEALIRGIAAEEKTNVPGTNRSGRWKQREEPDPYTRAKTLVYNQLAYSAKSRAQLQKKLVDKGFEESLIESLLDKFEAAHLIDDAEYARSFVEQRGKHKKLSRTALRRELKERGITGELAEDALAARTDEDEHRDAAELVRKKLRPSMNFSDRTEKEKIMRRLVGMLARRGYSSSVAFSVVKEEIEKYRSEQEEDC